MPDVLLGAGVELDDPAHTFPIIQDRESCSEIVAGGGYRNGAWSVSPWNCMCILRGEAHGFQQVLKSDQLPPLCIRKEVASPALDLRKFRPQDLPLLV